MLQRFLTGTFTIAVLTSICAMPAAAQSRWTTTATDGNGLQQGDATTVTWGFVADGTAITPALGGESNNPSGLIGFLDAAYSTSGGSDLTTRSWFGLFENIFDRWDAVSGLQFSYEPNDTGAAIDGTQAPLGQLGSVADIRIGGHSIDGQAGANTLAYNYFPNHGDMVIDTDNVAFYSNSSNNSLGLRNVLAHEIGHGLGISHLESNNSLQLMEPFINLGFDGPQIDDIYQAQLRYGDNYEEAGGNDTVSLASDLGTFGGVDVAVGSDANLGGIVNPTQVDFVSIDDDSDVDVWSFTLNDVYDMTLTLDMVGPQYNRGPQGGSQSAYNLSALSDLDLELLGTDGLSQLGLSDSTGLDVSEQLTLTLGPGTYFARITGRQSIAQFYEFRLSGTLSAIPEPGSALLLSGWFLFATLRRRR